MEEQGPGECTSSGLGKGNPSRSISLTCGVNSSAQELRPLKLLCRCGKSRGEPTTNSQPLVARGLEALLDSGCFHRWKEKREWKFELIG